MKTTAIALAMLLAGGLALGLIALCVVVVMALI